MGIGPGGGGRPPVIHPAPYLLVLTALMLSACGDTGGTASGVAVSMPPAGTICTGHCANAATFLGQAEVERTIAQAIAEAQARNTRATVAVVDRLGNVLGVFRMDGAPTTVTIGSNIAVGGLENVTIVPDTLAAITKAVTAAYLSSEGNAFSTRTASQIVQEHFNPGETLTPSGPLFGVQFSQLPCSELMTRAGGATPGPGPHRSPLGLAADPGGLPLYKAGTPVGGVGVVADDSYSLDRDVLDTDTDLEELIALAATASLAAPDDRRADRITVDGKTLRFSDATAATLLSTPSAAPAFAALNGVAGHLVAVPGYTGAATRAGLAYDTAGSGIRPDASDYAGLDARVLVDAADVPRYRPRAGTEPIGALNALEVREIVRDALAVANRTRAQIRRPLGSQARVTISVVDSHGVILGLASTRDAPIFGIDVALQKARTSAFTSSATAAAALAAVPDAVYLNGGLTVLARVPLVRYVSAARQFLGLPAALGDGGVAFSSRAVGNLARPFYPDGVDGNASGPFAKPLGAWSPFSTGVQLDLVYNALVQHVAFVAGAAPDVGLNCTGVGGFDTGFAVAASIPALANGLQLFAGGVPIYRGRVLIGAIGVSGDGVDQDDLIAFLGVDGAGARLGSFGNAPPDLRSDTLTPAGGRLRYVSCPVAPFLDSTTQDACSGR